MSALRKLASHTILYGFANIAARLLNFFLTPFYTRFFTDPGDYGTIALIYAYISFFNILYTYGMETGFFYYANREEKPALVGGTTFLSLLSSSVLFSGLMIVLSPWLAGAIHYPQHADYVVYGALILFFDTLTVIPFAWYRKSDKAAKFALLKFASIVLNIIFNIFFLIVCPHILANPSLSGLHSAIHAIYTPGNEIAYVFIANLLSSFIIFLFTLPDIFRHFELKWDSSLWRNIFRYSWPLLILGFAGMVNETLDRIMLDWRLPYPEATRQEIIGVYNACYKLSIFMTIAVQSFRYAAEPFFFAELKKEGSKVVYAKVLKYFSYITSLIFLGVMLFIPLLIQILGRNYRDAAGIVPILLLANLFLGSFVYLSQWYKQTEKTLYGAYISVGGAILTLLINYFFIPSYGYMASAWATLICYFAMAVITYLLGQKFYPVNYPIGRILVYILSAVGLYFISLGMQKLLFHGWHPVMYLVNALFLAVYLGLFFWLEKPKFNPVLLLQRIRNKA